LRENGNFHYRVTISPRISLETLKTEGEKVEFGGEEKNPKIEFGGLELGQLGEYQVQRGYRDGDFHFSAC